MYVITDIPPNINLRNEIRKEFYEEVNNNLNKLGLKHNITFYKTQSPLAWLEQVCTNLTYNNDYSATYLFISIVSKIIPVINNHNVIEFVSLFTNFIQIRGGVHYEQSINSIFSTLPHSTNLFFYYTGHGVRFIDVYNNIQIVHDVRLVIPSYHGSIDFYSRHTLQRSFAMLNSETSCIVIIDCCHGENLLELPLTFKADGKLKHSSEQRLSNKYDSSIIYLSSTIQGQTCGFYIDDKDSGSLFTHYLIKTLKTTSLNTERINKIHSDIEQKIHKYRIRTGKTPQNIVISYSHDKNKYLPQWLFENKENTVKIVEKID